jgi:hypothetical protein
MHLTAKRLYLIQTTINELFAEYEEVSLIELAKRTGIPFIQLHLDIKTLIECNQLDYSMMKYMNFKHTQYVKRVNKLTGPKFKGVRYFAKV